MSVGLKGFIDKYEGLGVVFSKDADDYTVNFSSFYKGERYDSSIRFKVDDELDFNTVINDVVNSFEAYFAQLPEGESEKIEDVTPDQLKSVETIKIKYHSDEIDKLAYIDGKSDWIDLRAAEDVEMEAGDFKLIPLNVSMKLPDGYEAWIVPRSSTFKTYGVLMSNSMGIVDNTYAGTNDIWKFPAYATRNTTIHKNDRICQFRIMNNQPRISFEEVDQLEEKDRGGFGSTGVS